MRRVSLGTAALAAVLAVPAHAATASGIDMIFRLTGTCAAGVCTTTLTTTQCRENSAVPQCSADPVSITMHSTLLGGGVCVLAGASEVFGLVVHTHAFGDVRVTVNALYDGAWQFFGTVGFGVGAFTASGGPIALVPAPCPASFSITVTGALVLAGV